MVILLLLLLFSLFTILTQQEIGLRFLSITPMHNVGDNTLILLLLLVDLLRFLLLLL
jgi:hypothetical protein